MGDVLGTLGDAGVMGSILGNITWHAFLPRLRVFDCANHTKERCSKNAYYLIKANHVHFQVSQRAAIGNSRKDFTSGQLPVRLSGDAEPLFDDEDVLVLVDHEAADADQVVGVRRYLKQGSTIYMDDLGSFYPLVKLNCEPNPP